MATTIPHFNLMVGDSGCGDISLCSDGTRLVVEYEFRHAGQDWVGVVQFRETVGHRFRDELHSTGYEQRSYDTVVEIIDSEWRNELLDKSERLSHVNERRHFAVLLSNNGYLEVIARCCDEFPSRKGLLTQYK